MTHDDRVLGRLEEFQKHSEKRFDMIERKIDSLNEFKWRMAGGAVAIGIAISGIIELLSWLRAVAHV